jgi:hypothetical protein
MNVRNATALLHEIYRCYLEKGLAVGEAINFVREDCAYKAFKIAHCNRSLGEKLYSDIMAHALCLDHQLWDRHRTQAFVGHESRSAQQERISAEPAGQGHLV